MTMQHDAVNELFGLAGTLPRPGWVVLDAARDHRFTGELRFDTAPPVRVFFDRGHIYLAERVTDPSLGARLVDAGALTAVQLERGSVRVGEVEHLGRLFERIPSLDRHTVVVITEMMTEECVGWLAVQRVPDVVSTPYRRHESGLHVWSRSPGWVDLAPGDPLPAPTADESPVSFTPLPSRDAGRGGDLAVEHGEEFLDGLIEWDEPSWLDGAQLERELLDPLAGRSEQDDRPVDLAVGASSASPARPSAEPDDGTDWVDRLEADGLPEDDLLATSRGLPRLPIEPVDRFEVVWPSGEVDEDFGAVDSVVGDGHDPDADRIGASARLGRPSPEDVPSASPAVEGLQDAPDATSSESDETDHVVLAVRRAVASIEVGSLAARHRLAAASGEFGAPARSGLDPDDTGGVPAPGRVAVRSGRNDWSRRTVTRSVFDEPAVAPVASEPEPATSPDAHRERRAGALRRLINSLRR